MISLGVFETFKAFPNSFIKQDIDKLRKSPLFNLKRDNIVITPHVAGATIESQTKRMCFIVLSQTKKLR